MYSRTIKKEKIFLSEFCRLKRATPTEWYVLLLEEKSLKTTVNIKKENIISTGRVLNCNSFHLNIFNLYSSKILKINPYKSVLF
jgi:hypothetical protein